MVKHDKLFNSIQTSRDFCFLQILASAEVSFTMKLNICSDWNVTNSNIWHFSKLLFLTLDIRTNLSLTTVQIATVFMDRFYLSLGKKDHFRGFHSFFKKKQKEIFKGNLHKTSWLFFPVYHGFHSTSDKVVICWKWCVSHLSRGRIMLPNVTVVKIFVRSVEGQIPLQTKSK